MHKPECARRGIGGPGTKGALSERIAAHVVAHPGGYTHGGTDYEARPVGYSGDLPTEATLCCCCSEDGCVAKAAAAAKEAAEATATAEGTEKAAAEV